MVRAYDEVVKNNAESLTGTEILTSSINVEYNCENQTTSEVQNCNELNVQNASTSNNMSNSTASSVTESNI